MRTAAEPFVGALVWTAIPAIPPLPPSFPLKQGKHRAGVAELVDALDLGSGRSALTNQTLKSFATLDCGESCANRAQIVPSPTSTVSRKGTANG